MDLKPFEPEEGDCGSVLIVKNYRPDAPWNEEANDFDREYKDLCVSLVDCDEAWKKMVEKYGKEEAVYFSAAYQLASTVGASWECRDCVGLSNDDYFIKRKR
jgi:hypothetical protein